MTIPTLSHFAGGQRLAAHSSRTSPVFDPATGAVSAQLPLADATDIRRVLDDAAAAAHGWGQLGGSEERGAREKSESGEVSGKVESENERG